MGGALELVVRMWVGWNRLRVLPNGGLVAVNNLHVLTTEVLNLVKS